MNIIKFTEGRSPLRCLSSLTFGFKLLTCKFCTTTSTLLLISDTLNSFSTLFFYAASFFGSKRFFSTFSLCNNSSFFCTARSFKTFLFSSTLCLKSNCFCFPSFFCSCLLYTSPSPRD